MQSSENKYLIVLITHKWGNMIEELYNNLSSCHKTILLIDDEVDKNQFPKHIEKIFFQKKNSIKLGPIFHKGNFKPLINIFNPILQSYDYISKYDQIYIWEYDVRYSSDAKGYQDFFKTLDNIDSDLVMARILTNYDVMCWLPKPSIEENMKILIDKDNINITKTLNEIPREFWSIGLFCLSRINKNVLDLLYNEMGKYAEYFEILVPTLVRYHGLTIKNISDINPSAFGSYSGNNHIVQIKDYNKLYHPIKDCDYIKKEEYEPIIKTFEQLGNCNYDDWILSPCINIIIYDSILIFLYKHYLYLKYDINNIKYLKKNTEDEVYYSVNRFLMEDWQIYKKQDLPTFCQIINLLYLMKSRIILLGGKAYDKYFDNIIYNCLNSEEKILNSHYLNFLCNYFINRKLSMNNELKNKITHEINNIINNYIYNLDINSLCHIKYTLGLCDKIIPNNIVIKDILDKITNHENIEDYNTHDIKDTQFISTIKKLQEYIHISCLQSYNFYTF